MMSQVAARFRNQIAKMHEGRTVNPYRTIATTSGAESFDPRVKELKSNTPKAKSPQIDPKPIITFVLSRMATSVKLLNEVYCPRKV